MIITCAFTSTSFFSSPHARREEFLFFLLGAFFYIFFFMSFWILTCVWTCLGVGPRKYLSRNLVEKLEHIITVVRLYHCACLSFVKQYDMVLLHDSSFWVIHSSPLESEWNCCACLTTSLSDRPFFLTSCWCRVWSEACNARVCDSEISVFQFCVYCESLLKKKKKKRKKTVSYIGKV